MTKEEFLIDLATQTGTDKLGHGYMQMYAQYLPDKCTSLLEIGIAEGKSALLWDEFYGKEKLDLQYLDLFINPDFVNERWCRNRGIKTHKGSQADLEVLSSIKDSFDVIIDDGSHSPQHQLVSFKALFLNNLKSSGVYFVEDLHCCKDEFYWGEEITQFEDTTLFMFQHYLEAGTIRNKFFNEGERKVFESLIDWVKIECDEKLAIIKRK